VRCEGTSMQPRCLALLRANRECKGKRVVNVRKNAF
jgi:hypothetical protein